MDRDSQIKAIEKTFEDNKKPIERHYSKANVVPVEILPVYPDFKVLLQRYKYNSYSMAPTLYMYSLSIISVSSYGNIRVRKLYLTLILRQLVVLYPHR